MEFTNAVSFDPDALDRYFVGMDAADVSPLAESVAELWAGYTPKQRRDAALTVRNLFVHDDLAWAAFRSNVLTGIYTYHREQVAA